MTLFLEALSLNSVTIIAAATFVVVFAAVAYVVFRMLRKTVKMAFRLAIVATIILIAIAGSISFWWLSGNKPSRAERPKATQAK